MKYRAMFWISMLLGFSTGFAFESSALSRQAGAPVSYPPLSSRVAASVGMGVEYVSAPDIVDYVRYITGQAVPEFKAGVQFFGAVSYPVSPDWVVKAEYVYFLASYDLGVPSDFTLTAHMPSVIFQYVLWDDQLYNVKIGGGLGYRRINFKASYQSFGDNLSGNGIGAVIDAEAATAFGDHLFAYLGCDARSEFVGSLKGSSTPLVTLPTYHALSVGARLGLSYYF